MADQTNGLADPEDAELGKEWLKLQDYTTNFFLLLSHKSGLLSLKRQLQKDGIEIEKFIGAGSNALVIEAQGKPNVVVRADHGYKQDPFKSDIVLKPVDMDKTYPILNTSEAQFGRDNAGFIKDEDPNDYIRVRTLLRGVQPPEIGLEDIMRTAAVMRTEGGMDNWLDVRHDQLYYIPKPSGEGYITYSDNKTPIAFIGAVDSTTRKDSPLSEQMKGMRNAVQFLADECATTPLTNILERIYSKEIAGFEGDIKPNERMGDFFPHWEKVLERVLDKDASAIKISIPEPLPQDWKESLRNIIEWENQHTQAKVSPGLADKIENLLATAKVEKRDIKVTPPVDVIDSLIPSAPLADVAACRQQDRAIESVKRSMQMRIPSADRSSSAANRGA